MSQTAAFRQLVRDAMRGASVLVTVGTTCAEVVRRMTEAAVESVLVTHADATICGIVTEQDIVRRLALRLSGDVPIERVMTAPVQSIRDSDYLYHAIATMRRLRYATCRSSTIPATWLAYCICMRRSPASRCNWSA